MQYKILRSLRDMNNLIFGKNDTVSQDENDHTYLNKTRLDWKCDV